MVREVTFDEDMWWGTCANTWHEEQKQFACATRMGLLPSWNCAHPPTFNLGGRSVLDIGGGPVSLLLKCVNFKEATVADPGEFPEWVIARYKHCGIHYSKARGEDLAFSRGHGDFDEAWIYNVLQHVDDPARVIENARAWARTIRIFEWIDIPPYDGHPHMLTKSGLEEWLGSTGFAANVNENGAVGRAFYGVFAT